MVDPSRRDRQRLKLLINFMLVNEMSHWTEIFKVIYGIDNYDVVALPEGSDGGRIRPEHVETPLCERGFLQAKRSCPTRTVTVRPHGALQNGARNLTQAALQRT
jgi:hypothetical protein